MSALIENLAITTCSGIIVSIVALFIEYKWFQKPYRNLPISPPPETLAGWNTKRFVPRAVSSGLLFTLLVGFILSFTNPVHEFTFLASIVASAVLFALLVLALMIFSRSQEETQLSALAGIGAGILALVICIIRQPAISLTTNVDLGAFLMVAGCTIGFFLISITSLLLSTRLVGIATFGLVATSAIALYSLLFVSAAQEATAYWSLGIAFGILFYVALLPDALKELLIELSL